MTTVQFQNNRIYKNLHRLKRIDDHSLKDNLHGFLRVLQFLNKALHGYKTFLMHNWTENAIYHAHKC